MASLDINMSDATIAQAVDDLKMETASEDEMDDIESTDESSVDESHFVDRRVMVKGLPTGLCYDERMRYHAEVAALSAEAVHPEDPRRIYYIYKELCEAGLVEAKGYELMADQPLYRIDARPATEEEICKIHTPSTYAFVKSTSRMENQALINLTDDPKQDSLYFNKLSYFSGKLSAGGAIETCKAVMERTVKNAIAVIRPPGHHAEPNRAMGFCLFNNTCIAAKACQDLFQEKCRKVLILDWDVHHGNGCQTAFYNDPNVLYISLHVHQNGKFYPQGPEGGIDKCGAGRGEGYNVNIGWENKGMGDGDYMYAFQHVVMPIANAFSPDFVVVSAGFDAAAGDELGGCNVTPACYAHMTHMLMSLAEGKLAVCLEGGYNFRAISRSALAVTRTLMGEPPQRLEATSATPSAVKTIEEVKNIQSKYWHCMYPKAVIGGIYSGDKLHDIIRKYQQQHLFDKYKLTELHIHRERISPSFDGQVLASLGYDRKQHLIVFFHDPPDLVIDHNPLTAQQKLHSAWMLDASQAYVENAINHHIGILDINIPERITITADTTIDENALHTNQEISYNSHSTDVARSEAAKLASYVWENYIEPYEFDGGIWLLGAGNAFHAVAKLLGENEGVYQRLRGVIGFICGNPLRPIPTGMSTPGMGVPGAGHWVQAWYKEHSRIFVAGDHQVWVKAEIQGKKISKKYGKLIKSPESILNSMMSKHLPEVFDYMRETGDFGLDDSSPSTPDPEAIEDELSILNPNPKPDSTVRPTASPAAAARSATASSRTSAAPGVRSPGQAQGIGGSGLAPTGATAMSRQLSSPGRMPSAQTQARAQERVENATAALRGAVSPGASRLTSPRAGQFGGSPGATVPAQGLGREMQPGQFYGSASRSPNPATATTFGRNEGGERLSSPPPQRAADSGAQQNPVAGHPGAPPGS